MWPVNFFHHCEFLELTGNDAGLRAGPHVEEGDGHLANPRIFLRPQKNEKQ